VLRGKGFLAGRINDSQLHDLGKMLFGFSTFWAYIWTCQYLLVWYGNIPEEVSHYLTRTNPPWLGLFALDPVVNWALPFAVLLSARAKQRAGVLAAVSVLLLLGHGLDLYLLIMPAVWPGPRFGAPELLISLGSACLLLLLFVRSLGRAPLAPLHDPVNPILPVNPVLPVVPVLSSPAQAKPAVEVT
jgi:hypothetical protein